MEAVCAQCQMRYEVPDELLGQGQPVACPTCQTALMFVHPGTSIPLELPAAAQAAAVPPPEAAAAGPEVPQPPPAAAEVAPPAAVEVAPAAPVETPELQALKQGLSWGSEEGLAWGAEEVSGPPKSFGVQVPVPVPAPAPPVSSAWEPKAASPAFESPVWDSASSAPEEASPAPALETAPVPAAPVEVTPPLQGSVPTPAPATAPGPGAPAAPLSDDWATAAARWAASGFSSDQMPNFVRAKEAAKAASGIDLPVSVSGSAPPPPVAPGPVVAPQLVQPTYESAAPGQLLGDNALQPRFTRQETPPPLHINPTPPRLRRRDETPPPMVTKRRPSASAGSEPWANASVEPIPESSPNLPPPSQMMIPGEPVDTNVRSAVVGGDEAMAQTVPEPLHVAKPPRTGIWVFLALVLVAAGGFGAWRFLTKVQRTDPVPAALAPGAPDAGVLASAEAAQPAAPPQAALETPDGGAAEVATLAPDAGAPAVDPATPPKPLTGKDAVAKVSGLDAKRPAKIHGASDKKATSKRDLALLSYKEGNDAIRKGQFAEAMKKFKVALAADSSLALAHRGLGICYAQLRRNKDACREYQAYFKMLPKDSKEIPALEQILQKCK